MLLPIDRFCSAVYVWMIKRVANPDEFDYHLTKPMLGAATAPGVVREELDVVAALIGGGV